MQINSAVKLDIIHTFYNIITEFGASRAKLTELSLIPALIKACKTIDSDDTLAVVGRIVRELCQFTTGAKVLLSRKCFQLLLLRYHLPDAFLQLPRGNNDIDVAAGKA